MECAENGDCYQSPAGERENKAFNRRVRQEPPQRARRKAVRTLNLRVDLFDALHSSRNYRRTSHMAQPANRTPPMNITKQ